MYLMQIFSNHRKIPFYYILWSFVFSGHLSTELKTESRDNR